jgi:outer membrane protein OmpA-like peptidoglycan-associated protein
MKKLNILLTVLTLLWCGNLLAQTAEKKWTFGYHYSAMDLEFVRSSKYSASNWNNGGGLSVTRYLNKYFNAAASLNANVLQIKADRGRTILLDAGAQYKFLNHFIEEGFFIEPYLFGNIGWQSADYTPKSSFVMATGGGLNLWLSREQGIAITAQSGYTYLPNTQKFGDYLHHQIGLRFLLGNDKDSDGDGVADKRDICPDVAGLKAFAGCPDADGDSIPDKDDSCPTVAGLAGFQGCPDTDGDSIADKDDTCPTVAGLAAFQGCPDTDGDGIADKDDKCPTVAGLTALQGCPDKDGDGVADEDDTCPEVAGVANFKGCPDTDGDGIQDSEDKCPNEAGIIQLKGCPEPKMDVAKVEKELKDIAKEIQFETGKDIIRPSSYPELDKVVVYMQTYPTAKFIIEGHTDNVGKADKNKELSQKRADAVKTYITDKGIDASRLTAIGYGSEKPQASNATAAGRAKNRRVEIFLNK